MRNILSFVFVFFVVGFATAQDDLLSQLDSVKSDKKQAESRAKLTANKEASADILAPIKSAKKLVEFGKWLNISGNQFRKEHFSKKYTQASVSAFLLTI